VRCKASLQANGNMNLPTEVVRKLGAAPAVSVRLAADGMNVGVLTTLSRWRNRGWLMFPAEARKLCGAPCTLEVDVEPVMDEVLTDARAMVPFSGMVRFSASVRAHGGGLLASVPLVWYRGMQRAGWGRTVDVLVRHGDVAFGFIRDLSVRAGESTVVLALPHAQCASLCPGDVVEVELRHPEHLSDVAAFPAVDWPSWSDSRKTAEVERLVRAYRSAGFPWQVVRSRAERDPLALVGKAKVVVEGDAVVGVSRVGQLTCLAAHPQRLRACYRGQPSVVEAFEDDAWLLKALRFQLDHGDPVVPHRLLRALSALVHGPMNFPPALARWFVDAYAPEGGVVLDPCSGYGGRLLGALASMKKVTYIGADVEPENATGNRELARLAGASDRVDQSERAVEDADWPVADLALVGPPYYNRERYGAAADARLAAYPTYGSWVEGFLRLLVERTMSSVPRAVFNVATLRDGKSLYDLPSDVIRLGERVGARVERVLTWRTSKFNAARTEKLIVLAR